MLEYAIVVDLDVLCKGIMRYLTRILMGTF